MNYFILFLFGIFTGFLVYKIDPKRTQGGLAGSLVVGITGAFGGAVFAYFLTSMGYLLFQLQTGIAVLLLAIVGAFTLLLAGRSFGKA